MTMARPLDGADVGLQAVIVVALILIVLELAGVI